MEFLHHCLNAVGPYVQMVEYADDFGSQAGPLISPKMFADIFLPAYQAQNALIKQLRRRLACSCTPTAQSEH